MLGADIGSSIGGAVGGIAVLAGAAGKGGERSLKKAVAAIRGTPEDLNLDLRDITPEELRIVAERYPEVYEAVFPQEVALPEDSAEGRQSQLYNISKLREMAEQGLPLQDRLRADGAQDAIRREQQRGQGAIMEDMAARGRLGGGTELAARTGFDQQNMDLARGLGADLVQQQILNRLSAMNQLGSAAGQLRGQDIDLSTSRANAVNRFNEYVSNIGTEANRYGADARNAAQGWNVENRQRVSDYNTTNRQGTRERNVDRYNAGSLDQGNFSLRRNTALAEALQALASGQYADQAAKANAIIGAGKGIGGLAGGAAGGGLG